MTLNFYRLSHQAVMTVLCVVMLLSASGLSAARIDRNAAEQTAAEFLVARSSNLSEYSPAGDKLSPKDTKALVTLAETDAYYVFTTSSKRGFVIVSADDAVSPIAGYSDFGTFDAGTLPPALEAYLSDYSKVVEAVSSGKIDYKRATRGGQAVEPLMTVQWNQSEPFNRLTPDKGENKAPTGCVATAIAQVMKYHKFPAAGRGTAGENNIYYPDQKIELGHQYDWNSMIDEYVAGAYSDAQADAVATLMRDVGYAVNMDYGYNESGASSSNISNAMCRHFNYSPDIKYVYRSCYTTQGWTDEIRASLLRAEPVLYGGVDGRNGGHQFVCDGIDADDMLHINWGWGGYGDGYFDMNILSPEYLGIGAGEGAYYRDQDMVFNIRPGDPDADYLDWRAPMTIDKVSVSSSSVDKDGRFVANDYGETAMAFMFRQTNSTGYRIEWQTIAFATMISDAEGNPVGIYNPTSFGSLNPGYYRNATISMYYKKGMLPDGHYIASIVLIPNDKASDPQLADLMPLSSGDLNSVKIKVENGELYLEDMSVLNNPYVSKLQLLDARSAGTLYTNAKGEFFLTVRNDSKTIIDKEYYNIYLIPESEDVPDIDLSKYSSCEGVDIFCYPGVETEVNVEVWNVPSVPGRYRLYLTYYSNLTQELEIVPSDQPFYIEVKEMPNDEVCMTSALKLNKKSYCRNPYIYFGAEFTYNNPGAAATTDIEVWARPKNQEGWEFLLLRKSGQYMYKGANTFSFEGWSDQDVVWFEPLGEYEAFVRYTNAEGNPRDMSGEGNHVDFTLIQSDATPYAEMSAPMVINHGKEVEAVDWTYFDVDIEFMSPTGLTIDDNGSTSVDVYSSPRSNRWLYSFTTSTVKFDKTVLAPGEKTTAHANILYRSVDEEKDLIGTELYVQFNYLWTEAGNCRIHPGAFIDTTGFKLVEEGAGIDGVAVDGVTPTVTMRPGGLTVSDINAGSTVSLYTFDGRCVYTARVDSSVMQIDGIATGMYLLRVVPTEGTQFATKVVIR